LQDLSSLILYKDHHFLAAFKPPLIPVQEDQSGDPSLQRLMSAYVKHDLYLCQRIDRPVSGLVLFGQTAQDQAVFQELMELRKVEKYYLALVPLTQDKGPVILKNGLIHDAKLHKAFVSSEPDARIAILEYSVLAQLQKYSVLLVKTQTGRFHQIRCQLAAAGLPIKGDVKYGARRSNKDRSIGLHAWKLRFQHPNTNQLLNLEAPLSDHDIWPSVQSALEHISKSES